MNIPRPAETLASLGVRPSARRGQAFLVRRETGSRIAGVASLDAGDAVLEIGPGLGALTDALLGAAGRVVAVESDRRLAAWLRERFRGRADFELIEGDALKIDLSALLRRMASGGKRVKVVANIPYSISGPLIARLVRLSGCWAMMALTVQRELALRIAAEPGGKAYGAFTVLCRCRATAREALTIAPGAFYPRPEVVSSVVVFAPLAVPVFPPAEEERLLAMVRLLFSQRRKSMGTVLRRSARGFPWAGRIEEAFAACGIDPAARPERLSPEEFNRLGEALRRAGWGRWRT